MDTSTKHYHIHATGKIVEEDTEILLEVEDQGICCENVSFSNVRSYTCESSPT